MQGHTIDNPWGLTDTQIKVVRQVIAGGSSKAAAVDLGLGIRTIDKHMRDAKARIGARTHVALLITFDRWDRSCGKGVEA